MKRVSQEPSVRPGQDIESLGVGMVTLSLVVLFILHGCLCYAAYYSDLPDEKANRLCSMTSTLMIVGAISFVGVLDFLLGGIHCCLFSLPLALGNYLVIAADLFLIVPSIPGVPLALRILIGIAVGVFILGHLMLLFSGLRRHVSDLPNQ